MAHILVVDDDLIYLDELANGLRAYGHKVETASSGHEGLLLMGHSPFDLAICDMIMTGGGALSFLHEVRAKDADFPIVVITGRRELATSPLFKQGMREASAKIQKDASVLEIDNLVRSLLM